MYFNRKILYVYSLDMLKKPYMFVDFGFILQKKSKKPIYSFKFIRKGK